MVNNFNCNSNGINVEFNGCYDNSLSYMDFKDNFETLESSRHCASVLFYTDYSQIESPDYVSDLIDIKASEEDLRKFLIEEALYNEDYILDFNKEELEETYLDYIGLSYSDICKDKLPQYVYLKEEFEIYSSRGYSQGDFVYIIVNKKALAELWSKDNITIDSHRFDNLLWDSPISGRLIVNDNEYYIQDYLTDSYRWDKEEFLKSLYASESFSDVEKKEIEFVIPEDLEYEG